MDTCYNDGKSPLYVVLTFNPDFGHEEEFKKKRSNQKMKGKKTNSRSLAQTDEEEGGQLFDITDQRPNHWM